MKALRVASYTNFSATTPALGFEIAPNKSTLVPSTLFRMARQCIKKSSIPNNIHGVTTPNHRPRRNLAAKAFWKKTWPDLKDQGWDYDGKRYFYPPDGFKQYAEKRFRAGSDVKEYFDGVSELGEYVRLNPEMKLAKKEDIAKSVNSKGTTEEEHKTASNDDRKTIGKENGSTKKSSKNGHGEAILRTPSSSPKEEPSGPDPKTDFRLTNTAQGSPPATLKKSKKKPSNTLKRVKTPRRTPSKSLDSGSKVYVCDRCGRTNFINGHALGGHKKYCMKPEYDEARARAHTKAKRSTDGRKRKRSSSFPAESASRKRLSETTANSISRTSSSSSSGFNLLGITNSIRDFADRVDDLDHMELDEALNTSDLFELQVIQTVLREEKARLNGRLAGLEAAGKHDPLPLGDIFNDIGDVQEQKSGSVDDEYETDLIGTELAMSLGF